MEIVRSLNRHRIYDTYISLDRALHHFSLSGKCPGRNVRMLDSSAHTIRDLLPLTASTSQFIHSFIHSGHFYSVPSSTLLLRGAPDYSTDTVSEFHAEAHRQLQVKDLPKVPTWRLERESNPRPAG